jgi:hypothetical protein
LVAGSLLFLAVFLRHAWEVVTWSSNPSGSAVTNTAHILKALELLGLYAVFATVVLGHAVLRRPPKERTEAESGATVDGAGRG